MLKELEVTKSIAINASPAQVWDAMTNPVKIAVYLYGTEAITDWKVGSNIVFQGNYQGHVYSDKGRVTANVEHELLSYDYWAQMSGLEDKPENYFKVNYIVKQVTKSTTELTWHQVGFSSDKGYEHTKNSLPIMLSQIKELVEKEK